MNDEFIPHDFKWQAWTFDWKCRDCGFTRKNRVPVKDQGYMPSCPMKLTDWRKRGELDID